MTKLRHIVGSNLKLLESQLEKVKNSIVVVGVNYVGTNWFIHFLVQDTWQDNETLNQELNIENKLQKKGRK